MSLVTSELNQRLAPLVAATPTGGQRAYLHRYCDFIHSLPDEKATREMLDAMAKAGEQLRQTHPEIHGYRSDPAWDRAKTLLQGYGLCVSYAELSEQTPGESPADTYSGFGPLVTRIAKLTNSTLCPQVDMSLLTGSPEGASNDRDGSVATTASIEGGARCVSVALNTIDASFGGVLVSVQGESKGVARVEFTDNSGLRPYSCDD